MSTRVSTVTHPGIQSAGAGLAETRCWVSWEAMRVAGQKCGYNQLTGFDTKQFLEGSWAGLVQGLGVIGSALPSRARFDWGR